ncbi:MAG: XisI protein, partial [Anaerolineae bacterium]|nr:XisI protein [Anaerolineae bacterium]
METLREKIASAVSGYAVKGLNGFSLLTTDSEQQTWVVASIAEVKGRRIAGISLLVRLVDDKIVIEHDINDKPLVDALMQA